MLYNKENKTVPRTPGRLPGRGRGACRPVGKAEKEAFSVKLTFLGAAHEVTGSCTLLTANGRNYLIDCGMEQGRDI